MDYLSLTLLLFTGLFLILIVLLQRGRGGGLAGAFGGMGGQSAFGTKAGDVFTKITVGVAFVWVLLAAGSGFALRYAGSRYQVETPNEPTLQSSDEQQESGGTGAGATAPQPGSSQGTATPRTSPGGEGSGSPLPEGGLSFPPDDGSADSDDESTDGPNSGTDGTESEDTDAN